MFRPRLVEASTTRSTPCKEKEQPSSMTKQRSPRKRNATLPRTYEAKREYMHYKASIEGKSLIHYIEDKAAPQRAVNAFIKAKDKLHADDNETNS